MRNNLIRDSDNLFRCCIHPLSFRKKGTFFVFAWDKFLRLQHDPEEGTLLGSLAWERYVPTTKHVHAYGCRVAFSMNEKERAKGKVGWDRRIYCGSYRLKAIAVRALATTFALDEISSADVIHHIENGEIAHTDMKISLKRHALDVEGTKTAILDRLWNACSGPLRYICDCDRDIEAHPNLNLSTPPQGQYADDRSCQSRLWSLIRFLIHSWFWRSFCQKATKIKI